MGLYLRETELDRLSVLQRVISGQRLRTEAIVDLGISMRQLKRLLARFKTEGAAGVKLRHRGGNRKFSESFKCQVMSIVREKYPDFGASFAVEKLKEVHDVVISKETLRQWMIAAKLRSIKKRQDPHIHQCRPRRPRLGELIQIDGSHHDWFEGRAARCCLTVFIDDATSRIQCMRFESSETTLGYLRCLKDYLDLYGRPLAFYSDRHSIFKTTRESCEEVRFKETQFHRVTKQLGIELICAKSSQAKGRVERANKTLQDRLIKEMRLRNICSMEDGNAYLSEFIFMHNKKFSIKPANFEDAHRPIFHSQESIQKILSLQANRKVTKNLEFSYENTLYQIQGEGRGRRLQQAQILVCEDLSGNINVFWENRKLSYTCVAKSVGPLVCDEKGLDEIVDRKTLATLNPERVNAFG